MRSRVIVALVSGLATLGVTLALAVPAAAATGPKYYSPEQAGYVATGARFQYVQSSVVLPDASSFASEVSSYGLSVQLRTPYRVVVLGVSNTTTAGNYSAAAAVFNKTKRSLICSTAGSGTQACPHVGSRWTDGSVTFAPGDHMTLAILYDRSTGVDHFFVDDDTTGVELFYGGYAPGTGQSYSQARVGAEFAASPWSSFTYTAPASETPLVTFQNSVLVTYRGNVSGFASSWTHDKILATSTGTSTGTVEVAPHNLTNFGSNFGVYLEP
jgi:hypothetical protein